MIVATLTLALLHPPVLAQERDAAQEPAAEVAEAPLARVLPPGVARFHDLPMSSARSQLIRAEAVLRDPLATAEERDAALARYLDELDGGSLVDRAASLADTLRFLMGNEGGGAPHMQPSADGRALLVVGTSAQHEVVAEVLEGLEDERRLVDVESRIHRLPAARVAELTGGRTAFLVEGEARARLLAGLAEVDVLTAPRVLAQVAAPVQMSVLSQTAYISDYELTVLEASRMEIVDPVIEVIQEGLTVEVRAAPWNGKLRTHVSFTSSSLERPIPEVNVQVGPGKSQVTVQKPRVANLRASALFDLEGDTAIVLVATDPSGKDEDAAVVVMTARLVEPDGMAK